VVRRSLDGNVLQEIIREGTYTSSWEFPSHSLAGYKKFSFRFFLQAPGKSRTELRFLRGDIRYWLNPVDESSLWVAVHTFVEPKDWTRRPKAVMTYKIGVFVFDGTHLIHDRQLVYSGEESDFPGASGQLRHMLLKGSRTLLYWANHGILAYDVGTDTIAPWKGEWPKESEDARHRNE
jgi:hypothetical protein